MSLADMYGFMKDHQPSWRGTREFHVDGHEAMGHAEPALHHSGHDEGTDARHLEQHFLMPYTLLSPGICHAVHNIEGTLDHSLKMFPAWLEVFKPATRIVRRTDLLDRFVTTCS